MTVTTFPARITPTRPCTRHRASVWLASCADCTSWHLAAQIARRNGGSPVGGPAAPVLRPAAAPRVPQHAAA